MFWADISRHFPQQSHHQKTNSNETSNTQTEIGPTRSSMMRHIQFPKVVHMVVVFLILVVQPQVAKAAASTTANVSFKGGTIKVIYPSTMGGHLHDVLTRLPNATDGRSKHSRRKPGTKSIS